MAIAYEFVIVINDNQGVLVKSIEFQEEEERMLSNFKAVDKTFLYIDLDRAVCTTLQVNAEKLGQEVELTFSNS